MLPRISLLDELQKGGYEASLITTFNAYLPFYEEVVLRRLVNAGVRHNVLMMDANQYAHSLASHPPKLAGRNYTLLPIKVAGAFHPKLVILAGKQKGLVLVGSHNMTLAGFGFNRELTNLVRIQGADDAESTSLVRDLWAEIDYWLGHFAEGVPDHVRRMAVRVKEFAPWITTVTGGGSDIKLLAGRPGAQPLWEQLSALIDDEAANVSLTGAFFDQELRFIEQVNRDLAPRKFTVAVDPETVEIPARARTASAVSLVRADGLGVENVNEAESNCYLHAKGIFVEQLNGSAVFASGSANPSAPAWLPSDRGGNVELMLAYRGERARTTAEAMGFNLIADMPVLNDKDWQSITFNEEQHADLDPLGYRSGLALVEGNCVVIDKTLLGVFLEPSFVLCDGANAEISISNQFYTENKTVRIEFSEAELESATTLHVLVASGLVLKLLLHHVQEIEEQARSSTQRRFKEALLSLETDTPNIELLIQCIDKIVFSEAREAPAPGLRKVGAGDETSVEEQEAPVSLAIDVADIKRRKSKMRLSHSGDFAYGLLHSPEYREPFKNNLAKQLPRIPAVKSFDDFAAFRDAGRALGDLHVNFETVEPYMVTFKEGDHRLIPEAQEDPKIFYRVKKMKFGGKGKEKDKTTVIYNENITMQNIPLKAYDYVVNGKPALEWVMERQVVKTDKASGIVNDANDYANETIGDPRYPMLLFQRVITVSLETIKIVKGLPKLEIESGAP